MKDSSRVMGKVFICIRNINFYSKMINIGEKLCIARAKRI
ncbi:Phenol hydroxylase [Legionella pneumophila subsp. pneumophila LPE509]|nr:Phenol hydroxylase [Legionella pneumophila subsp. pneumophila LPE509]